MWLTCQRSKLGREEWVAPLECARCQAEFRRTRELEHRRLASREAPRSRDQRLRLLLLLRVQRSRRLPPLPRRRPRQQRQLSLPLRARLPSRSRCKVINAGPVPGACRGTRD